MRFGVLGPLMVRTTDGAAVTVPGAKVRALLAQLLVHPGRPVSAERLIDGLWGGALPDHPANALQGKVSQLRRALEKAEPGGRDLVASGPAGYALRVAPDDVDATRFTALVERARGADGPRERVRLLTDALDLWRGDAFADFAGEAFARGAVDRLDEARLTAREEQAEARLDLGEHGPLAADLAGLVVRHPARERLRAAQLRALYRSGRQTEALAAYEDLRRRLADDLGLVPGPDLAALHGAILRQDPALDGPPPAPRGASPAPADRDPLPRPPTGASGARTNLPAPVSGLVGRDDAVPGVRRLLGATRLVTLTGPGGVGKTRLAVAAARGLVPDFPDGVWLVELAGIDAGGDRAAEAVAEAVTRALGLHEEPGAGPPRDAVARLTDALRARRLLLVLDNCEHVVDAVAAVAAGLLRDAADLTVLATSQEPLDVSGERVFPVPPLELGGAMELFVRRAGLGPGAAALGADDTEAVAELCVRLDGLPLALELAAARVRTLGVHGLLARIDDRFALLGRGFRGAPARQRTLRAVIDWSWSLLSEPERTVLRRLAVHDGCGLAGAEAVGAGGGVRAPDVLDLLARLVDRSLVVASDRPDGPRYCVLESVRAYGAERLRDAGEFEEVRERHSVHYAALAERGGAALRGPEQRRWLERLDEESGNLRRALDTAVARGAVERALRMVNSLAWYWVLRGRAAEARRSLDAALALAPVAAGLAPGTAAARALALAWRTGIALREGDEGFADACAGTASAPGAHRDVDPPLAAALAAYQHVDDPSGRATALWVLGAAQLGAGAVRTGERLVNEALDAFDALGDRWGTAAALSVRARHAMAHGDLAAVRRDSERSALLFRELGDAVGQLQTVFPLAALSEIAGDYAEAARLHDEGLAVAERLGLWAEASKRLSGRGRIALLTGDLAGARAAHERALGLARDHGFRSGEIDALIGLGLGARREGDLDGAERHMRELLAWFRRADYGPGVTLALAELGFAAELRGDAAAARALHADGFAAALPLGDPRALALALEGLAGAEAAAGAHGTAATLLGAAAAARASVGTPLPDAERGDVDRAEAAARARLGAESYTTAFKQGQRLSPVEARGLVAPA
ncbi:BTAD domain-containing putative transcriptional regulator [Streptomyces spectabilis]|uniref:AfsR/SARP family transcriptional regulator n=1 Tax=Streptomyces spectabilis TaxID=68270 RepID=A0A5P2XLT3_STRST|nr:BTAD domain-containing putative transcriptional regulator [Streptomyces spectabilis]MBB5101670.1 putative ATPase/DNA-binding SARP family transcriptional activator [Streptomyces spectabilis]MCI3900852.1 winged helix-turn-helix domain-containing protein [Streptomyces spectabilis]QEV64504.1 AfsR/SARP family transcriptional regulator [Streptomyces spectabilis]